MSMSSARLRAFSPNDGGRSISQKRDEIKVLPFAGVHEAKGDEGAMEKGSAASRKHAVRMGNSKNRALRIDVSLFEGNSIIGVFVQAAFSC
jgi:hypothetical protein